MTWALTKHCGTGERSNRSFGTGDKIKPVPEGSRLSNSLNFNDFWSHPPGSNRRPADYESAALPTELGWLSSSMITTCGESRNRVRSAAQASPSWIEMSDLK